MRWTPVRRVARESVSWRGFLSYWSSGNSFARSMSGPRRKVQLWPIIQGVRETSKLATTYKHIEGHAGSSPNIVRCVFANRYVHPTLTAPGYVGSILAYGTRT